ncbi:methylmalonyl-CoA mutase subunit beta [Neobacillus sp. PS3-40]|uniref:methylmalonyl-CoA mutase subunit beta n=1 Tax=Neobacillus sp. PS3-40 TaxID=3070679 RepID=UPI0027E06936|nr:methylmalonyl-CoA mutase subunit beta [Neobacillus sp. PS3-40]WML45224.1 methylmalonyl-CoA mutase subunit beta [Neobacillus sp. PS3-40]
MRNQSFPLRSEFEWKEKAEESLKGKSIQSLQTSTYENITLKPLYCRVDEKLASDYPGGSDFRRGKNPLGYIGEKWKIAQSISYKTPLELIQKLEAAIDRGLTALSFELNKSLVETEPRLLRFIKEISANIPFAIDANGMFAEALSTITDLSREDSRKVTGYIASDPLATFVVEGFIPKNQEQFFAEWSEIIKNSSEKLPNLQTILVNTSVYHNGGANAVQELGIAAATGVLYLQQLLEKGIDQEVALSKIIFKFSIGSNFFMEIAKLRAARIIWNKITEVYGAKMVDRGMKIAAETSIFTKSVSDQNVNLLRAGNEAFAAVIGGIQYLHVTPFDQMTGSTYSSERIAQNTQLILQEEVLLQKVIDPAGGSWYIEELTRELAEKSWELFKKIEANGGMLEALKSNWLQKEISTVNKKRHHDISTRKVSIVGTNVYANLTENIPECEKSINGQFSSDDLSEKITIETIPQIRLSQPYEDLRMRADRIKRHDGVRPFIGLICLGNLKQYKPRADFIRGFLAAGGVNGLESGPIFSTESVTEFVKECNSKHFCLCGSNEEYENIGLEILQLIKAEFPDRIVYLAGLPKEEDQSKWVSEGIKSFIHVKSNCCETLESMLSEMELTLYEA